MIVILVYGPDFACSENLTQTFSQWGETHLISLKDTDWRDYDPGLLVGPKTIDRARQIVATADLIFLGDALALKTLGQVAPDKDWIGWSKTKRVVGFFGDSAYYFHSRYYDGMCREIGMKPLFLLPNLIPMASLPAVPLHHPMPTMVGPKALRLTVMHSPGRDGKAITKGTLAIEEVIGKLQTAIDFDYQRLMHLTLADCLRIKSTAHIVIDQMPPEGAIYGLGRSGLEGLAAGSVVVTAMYDTTVLQGYFEPPPVVAAHTPEVLESKLRRLLVNHGLRERLARASVEWAGRHVEFGAWLKYVGQYL